MALERAAKSVLRIRGTLTDCPRGPVTATSSLTRTCAHNTHRITFVALTETYRLYVIRRRQSIYAAYLSGHYPPFISLRDVVHARFATLRCWMTGRFLNVTHEWREQTIYEFLFHHLVYRPLTGRTWWRGGLSDDPAVKEATLPAEEVDTALLLRNSARHRSAGRGQHLGGSGELQPFSGGISSSSSSSENGDEDDWEKLEASQAGSFAPDSAPAPTKVAHTATEAGSDAPFEMTYTWLGQSTSLVQMGGITLLTDPVFAAQPVESVLAPTRLRPPPLTAHQLLDELRIVDVIQISHDHFDHLDEEFVRAVAACADTHAREMLWVVPLGVKAFLVQRGIADAQVVEMDWWQEETVCVGPGPPDARKKLRIVCTPAQHWAGRNGLDTNRRLWCGFITREVQDGERGVAGSQPEARSFFHAGDSGYSSGEGMVDWWPLVCATWLMMVSPSRPMHLLSR